MSGTVVHCDPTSIIVVGTDKGYPALRQTRPSALRLTPGTADRDRAVLMRPSERRMLFAHPAIVAAVLLRRSSGVRRIGQENPFEQCSHSRSARATTSSCSPVVKW